MFSIYQKYNIYTEPQKKYPQGYAEFHIRELLTPCIS